MAETIYTVGHSNHTIERLLELLARHGIAGVADVRSQPYGRLNPQFNREALSQALIGAGLSYVFLGEELGARSRDPACYRDGRAQYSLIAKTSLFEKGIDRLLTESQNFRVAMICAEKEPLVCHRTILIGRYLHQRNVPVRHILEDGSLEDHEASLLRLLAMLRMQENDLFRTKDELIAIACEMQAEKIEFSASQVSQPA